MTGARPSTTRTTADAIRTATAADIDAIKRIAIDTNMFGPDEVDFFDEMITGFIDGTMDDTHWLVAEHDSDVVAAAYYAPELFSDRMWNLYFILSHPTTRATAPAEHSSTTSNNSSAPEAATPHAS